MISPWESTETYQRTKLAVWSGKPKTQHRFRPWANVYWLNKRKENSNAKDWSTLWHRLFFLSNRLNNCLYACLNMCAWVCVCVHVWRRRKKSKVAKLDLTLTHLCLSDKKLSNMLENTAYLSLSLSCCLSHVYTHTHTNVNSLKYYLNICSVVHTHTHTVLSFYITGGTELVSFAFALDHFPSALFDLLPQG